MNEIFNGVEEYSSACIEKDRIVNVNSDNNADLLKNVVIKKDKLLSKMIKSGVMF